MNLTQALNAFLATLASLPINADPRDVAEDTRDLRIAFPDDVAFIHALQSLAYELHIAAQRPNTHGVPYAIGTQAGDAPRSNRNVPQKTKRIYASSFAPCRTAG